MVSVITVKGVSEDVTYTCTFTLEDKQFTQQAQVRAETGVYSVYPGCTCRTSNNLYVGLKVSRRI